MKALYYFLFATLLFAGCSKDENPDDFQQYNDFAEFHLDGDHVRLSKKGFNSKGVFTHVNQANELETLYIAVGRGVNKDGTGQSELDFVIVKQFLPEDLGINPQEFDNQVQITSDNLY